MVQMYVMKIISQGRLSECIASDEKTLRVSERFIRRLAIRMIIIIYIINQGCGCLTSSYKRVIDSFFVAFFLLFICWLDRSIHETPRIPSLRKGIFRRESNKQTGSGGSPIPPVLLRWSQPIYKGKVYYAYFALFYIPSLFIFINI